MVSNANTSTTTSTGVHNNTNTTTTTTTTSVTFGRRSRDNATLAPPGRRSDNLATVPTHSSEYLTPQVSHEPFPALPSPSLSRAGSRALQPQVSSSTTYTVPTGATQARQRPIGIKRLSSNDVTRVPSNHDQHDGATSSGFSWSGERRRSASAPMGPPQHPHYGHNNVPLQRVATAESNLPTVVENEEQHYEPIGGRPNRSGSGRLRRASDAARNAVNRLSGGHDDRQPTRSDEYETEVVDLLDVLDPEVAALTTLTNVQNSLFVPDLGRWLNRRPTFQLSRDSSKIAQRAGQQEGQGDSIITRRSRGDTMTRAPTRLDIPSDIEEENVSTSTSRPRSASVASIASHIKDERYAVLPHGVNLHGWTEDEIEMLDDHVRHMLHSKRSKFKRSMRAFGKYVSKPLGFLVTFYAFTITVFGLAWVLFLIGWISVGARKSYLVHVIDLVLVALFAVVGDGLAPFRAIDTYHMIYIAHYHRLSWRLRKKRNLPRLQDHNDLPEQHQKEIDIEAAHPEDSEFSVLTPAQQVKLVHHQNKFSKSHSFYKPHETSTHYAFPLKLLIAIVSLLDAHSGFQIALGSVTWSTNYKTLPKAVTPVILSCSITVNILAGILIKVGDNRTRKKDILEKMYRQQLTEEAMRKVEKRAEKEKEADLKQDKRLDEEWDKKHSDPESKETGESSASDSRRSDSR